jgi:rSAM/selenodomain-associated transferase 2
MGTFQEHLLPLNAPHRPASSGPSLSPRAQGKGFAPSLRLRGDGWRISVIIPALNAADTLAQLVSALQSAAIVHQIIVVDGGSSDETIAIARAAGAAVVEAPRGRGTQLRAGAAAARTDWLLFLHADCRLLPSWDRVVMDFLAEPQAAGRAGYFDFALDDDSPSARRLERIVAWRCRILALPYGDQGLLIASALYEAVGGFAPLPLMEDVDLARRLGRQRLARIGGGCVTSPRRYRRDGYWRRPLRNLFCLSLYFAGVRPDRVLQFYG